jgi:GntR family transcriptional regulator, transcriptional repressor for pyruvate dehydrogenase complex
MSTIRAKPESSRSAREFVGVADEAIQKIKAMILAEQLRPGAKLPPEPELAAQLGVSRSSLREAVRALALMQVLEVRWGDGTYVTSLEPAVLMEGASFIVDLLGSGRELEFIQLRRILEPAAAALATGRIDAQTTARLHQHVLRMEAATSVEDLAGIDIEFHRTLVQAAGSPLLTSLLENLFSEPIRARVWHLVTVAGAAEATTAEHRAIFEAVCARDPDLARATVAMHIAQGETWVRHLVDHANEPIAPPASAPAAAAAAPVGVEERVPNP